MLSKVVHTIAFIMFIITGMILPTYGATSSTLNLSGNVAMSSEVVVTPITSVISNLTLNSTASVIIASISAKSNNKTGYVVSLSSVNNWALKESLGDSYLYTLSFGGVDLSKTANSVDLVSSTTKGKLAATDLAIHFVAVSSDVLMNSGDYTDTLIIVISSR